MIKHLYETQNILELFVVMFKDCPHTTAPMKLEVFVTFRAIVGLPKETLGNTFL